MKQVTSGVLAVLAWMACSTAFGEVVRFHYEAQVTSLEIPEGHTLEGQLDLGDTFSGLLQYDVGLSDELDNLPTVGSYEALPAGDNRFRASDGRDFVFDSAFIPRPFFVATVDDGDQFDTLLVNMSGDTSPSTLVREDTRFVQVGLLLETTDTSTFTDDGLPRRLSGDEFELAGIDFFGTGSAFPTFLIQSTIVSLDTMPPVMPGDYNSDGTVEQGDLDLVLLTWGLDGTALPIDWAGALPDTLVDQSELDAVLLNWGSRVAQSASVPEPATWALFLVGSFALVVGGFQRALRC